MEMARVKAMEHVKVMVNVPAMLATRAKHVTNALRNISNLIGMMRNSCAAHAIQHASQMLAAPQLDQKVCANCNRFCLLLQILTKIKNYRLPGVQIGLDDATGRWRMYRYR